MDVFDGTPVLVPVGMSTDPGPQGDILVYPEGDRTAPASGRMPHGGYYFDSISHKAPFEEASLSLEEDLEEFGPISDADLEYFRSETKVHEQA